MFYLELINIIENQLPIIVNRIKETHKTKENPEEKHKKYSLDIIEEEI